MCCLVKIVIPVRVSSMRIIIDIIGVDTSSVPKVMLFMNNLPVIVLYHI